MNSQQLKDQNSQGTTNKTLKRLQSPIFELKKKEQTQHEYVLRKMMTRKQPKPSIGTIERSPLFRQLQAMMPIFRKANEQLKQKIILQQDKIDAKLVQVQESDSSSSAEEDEEKQEKLLVKQVDEPLQDSNEMVDQAEEARSTSPSNQIQLNFLRYEMPQKAQLALKQNRMDGQEKKTKNQMIEEII